MTQILIDPDAIYVLGEAKKILQNKGQTSVSDSDAIVWLADTVNTLVDEIQQVKDELKLYKNSVPLEVMR